ncbi:MAG: prepilin-type N-terminal cleavage/methylation domain-containing protein [Synergistaceae bacterium]|nr:prepilin-type N-terminal cleavage/methylation domain-containing protein [Synergistaceae bacterium]
MFVKKAFTLVEVLIVVIIIGILAGLMMTASGASTQRAEDTRAINDIVVMRKALMIAFVESGVECANMIITIENNKITISSESITKDDSEKFENKLRAALDANLAAKHFKIYYDTYGNLGTLNYYPKSENFPWYFISQTSAEGDMSIYCYDDKTYKKRLVKSY